MTTIAVRPHGIFAAANNLKIKTKVLLGFAVVLALVGVVGGVSVTGFESTQESFDSYTRTSDNTVRIAVVDRDLLLMRRNVLAYTISGDEAVAKRVRDGAIEGKSDVLDILTRVRDPDRKAKLSVVPTSIDAYLASFEKAVVLRNLRDSTTKDRITIGTKSEEYLREVVQGALAEKDYDTAIAVGTIQEAMMSARLSANRFNATPTEPLAAAVRKDLDRVITISNELAGKQAAGRQRELIEGSQDLIKKYATSFNETAKAAFDLDTLVNKTMSDMAAAMGATLTDIRKSQAKSLSDGGLKAQKSIASASSFTMILSASAFLIGLILAWVIGRGISTPVIGMTAAMQKLAGGDKSVEIPAQGRRDEIGQMAGAVEIFKHNMIEAERLRVEQEQAKARTEAEKVAAMNKMADEFEASVKGIVQTVSSAATELQSTSTSMSSTAEETQKQSTAVAAASEQASTNVQTVASAAEELSSSIAEISRQVSDSARIAGQAVHDAEHTNAQVQALAEAAQKIGDVVKLINDIAGQTNLLALNATIEAARAGEAGKGFAVVASEVKSLATQTAKATEDIAAQINAIQAATGSAVQAIGGIGQTIGRINEIATTIASAVEEQGAATKEIARNVQQASAGTNEVSANIANVTQAATETGAAASQVLSSAGELAKQSENLSYQVDAFIAKIRAA
jgi:methyl-accepting chemotaxis protein